LIGSLPAVIREQLDFFDRAHAECGDIFALDLGVIEVVVVAHPDFVEQVLVKDAQRFDRNGKMWDAVREAFGDGLAMAEGEVWRRQRRLLNPSFRRECIQGFRKTITQTCAELVDELEATVAASPDGVVDIAEWTPKLLSTLTLRLLFGIDFEPATSNRLKQAVSDILDWIILSVVTRSLPSWFPIPGRRRYEAARATLDEVVLALIAERRRSPVEGGDLLGLLLEAADEKGAMTDTQLRDEVVVTYLAGYETTAWALAWGLWRLTQHPQLVHELQAALDEEPDATKIPLVDATFREILRLYPSAPFVQRRVAEDLELLGYPIRRDTIVFVSPWLVQRHPEFWPDPLRFDPRRFLDEDQVAARHKYAWIPFSAGQRICLGKGLAMMEGTLALGEILRRFTPRPADGPPPLPRLSTTLRPRGGIRLRLEPR
jgi:cytochrome P450